MSFLFQKLHLQDQKMYPYEIDNDLKIFLYFYFLLRILRLIYHFYILLIDQFQYHFFTTHIRINLDDYKREQKNKYMK